MGAQKARNEKIKKGQSKKRGNIKKKKIKNMLMAIIFILLGLFLLLNAMGIIAGSFWGFFWAIVLIAIGIKMLRKNGSCPVCEGMCWHGKMHSKIQGKCDCGHDHGAGESKHDEQN